jgi:hypothetical protein
VVKLANDQKKIEQKINLARQQEEKLIEIRKRNDIRIAERKQKEKEEEARLEQIKQRNFELK